ncbi:MAG: TetR/AcrR family transcriptional regulator [Actinomycetota bacterium]|nr:TetR/AcrR family transcriptional regulator [Myxococcales bacterium]MDH4017729.1 TetR/AcrR family transcriptional regulator [Actinomycetota bacterium]
MPKIVDRVERRAAIAAAAAGAIADEGIEAVTMKGIAARAGVTTGAVTHYFNDKDEVILAALLFVDAAMRSRLDVAFERSESLVDALLAALPNDPASRRDWRVWRVFTDAASRSDLLMSHYREANAAWLDTAMHVLAEQLERRPDERDAQLVVAVVDSIGDTASADPTSWPQERQRQLIQHCLGRLEVVDDSVPAPSSARRS